MRIALVHMRHARTGGTEGYLNQLSAFLAERGHEVTVVCRSHAEPSHPSIRFEQLRPLAIGGAWRMWSFARATERHLANATYDLVVGLGKTWSQDVLRLGGGVQRTYLELAHDATLGTLERAAGTSTLKQRIACAIEDRALRPGAAAAWIANSEMVRRDVLARFGLPERDVVVVHNGVDLERFHPRLRASEGRSLRESLELADGDLVVLFLGSGYGRKGLRFVLDAFAPLARERSNARLVVVGNDSAADRYRARATELGIANATRFLGPRADAHACFAAADLYVLPTLYDPFANATLEALASGLPVITSDQNGAAELLTPGREGAVVPAARATESLRAELARWLDRERIEAARPRARELAERHGHARAMNDTLAVLERAHASLDRARRRP